MEIVLPHPARVQYSSSVEKNATTTINRSRTGTVR